MSPIQRTKGLPGSSWGGAGSKVPEERYSMASTWVSRAEALQARVVAKAAFQPVKSVLVRAVTEAPEVQRRRMTRYWGEEVVRRVELGTAAEQPVRPAPLREREPRMVTASVQAGVVHCWTRSLSLTLPVQKAEKVRVMDWTSPSGAMVHS